MITICYITFRREPRIQWFFDSLHRELDGNYEGVEVIVVANHANDLENLGIHDRIPDITFTVPKPSVWAGKHRLTSRDYFAASNARNTGLCWASGETIVYVDDLSVLMPGWWERVKIAAETDCVACGVYRKVFDLEVEEGRVKSFRDSPGGHDTRLPQLDSDAVKPCSGGWLYGCSVAMPVEALLKINGWDEDCDSMGFEDCSCGFRLQRSGADLRIDPKMMTWESEEGHNQGTPALRIIKPYPGWKDSSCFMENYFKFGDRIFAPNYCNMRELRQKILAGEPFPIPTEPSKDWRDGQALSEM